MPSDVQTDLRSQKNGKEGHSKGQEQPTGTIKPLKWRDNYARLLALEMTKRTATTTGAVYLPKQLLAVVDAMEQVNAEQGWRLHKNVLICSNCFEAVEIQSEEFAERLPELFDIAERMATTAKDDAVKFRDQLEGVR